MNKLLEENQELSKIVLIGLAGLIFAVAIIVFIIVRASNIVPDSYYDEYTEQQFSAAKTGGGYNKPSLKVSGFDLLLDYDLSSNEIVMDTIKTIRNFINLTHPEIAEISVVKKSITKNDETISFRLHSGSNEEFSCLLTDYNNGQYSLKISDKNSLILEYDTSKLYPGTKNPKILAKKYLPYTIRQDGPAITVVEESGLYKILVSSCGNEKIKQEARDIVENWLKSYNFDPQDFNFEIPTICDGEVEA